MHVGWRCNQAEDMYQLFIEDDGTEHYASTRSCTCASFAYNGSCKHVAAMWERACTWSTAKAEQDPGVPDIDPRRPGRCPVCGSSVSVYTTSVETSD